MSKRNPNFSRDILSRDKICQECGSVSQLHAHHITPVSEGGTDEMANGVALCAECHADKHPDMPKNLFLIKASGDTISGDWNRTSLAAHLECSTRTVTRAAKRLGIERHGYNWAFTNEECAKIRRLVKPRQKIQTKAKRKKGTGRGKGGAREGAGRKPRQDGRPLKLYKIAVNENEAMLIRDMTNPDERRQVLLAYIERKQAATEAAREEKER